MLITNQQDTENAIGISYTSQRGVILCKEKDRRTYPF